MTESTELLLVNANTTKHREANNSLLLTEKIIQLLSINLYSVLFYICSFNFLNALLNMTIVPENKSLFDLLCVFVMCIFVLIFNNKDKIMTKSFYLSLLWSKYSPYFFLFRNLERICLYNREIILAALLRQNSKINMTKQGSRVRPI